MMMNKKMYMTLVNAIAKVIIIEGEQKGAHYAKLSVAHKIVRNGELSSISDFVNIEAIMNDTYNKDVVTVTDTTIKVEKKKAIKKSNKVLNKVAGKKAVPFKRGKKVTEKNDIDDMMIITEELKNEAYVNVYKILGEQGCETIKELIENHDKYSIHHYHDKLGYIALKDSRDLHDIQKAMFVYFLKEFCIRTANKYLSLGLNLKSKRNIKNEKQQQKYEQKNSYQNAPSSSGIILEFTAMDLYGYVIESLYEKEMREEIFHGIGYTYQTIFFKISNILQSRLTEGKRQARAKNNIMESYGEFETQSLNYDDMAYEMAVDNSLYTKEELRIIELRLAGFTKVEIDQIIGKRTDRTFNSLKKKYISENGEPKKYDVAKEVKRLAKNKKEMKERVKAEKERQKAM